MDYLADTNVAVRRVLPNDAKYSIIKAAIDNLHGQGDVVYISPQILLEFHALATRPLAANRLGMHPSLARLEAQRIESMFPLLQDIPEIHARWGRLIDTYAVAGRQVYDTRLVAVMQTYGITRILTLNGSHFRRFAGITVVEP